MRKIISITALVFAGTISGTAFAQSADDPPSISAPANNVGDGPAMPNIRLPDGWSNPNTGGEGGYVNNGVPVEDTSNPPSSPADDSSDDIGTDGE
jgi:hypothetical protein